MALKQGDKAPDFKLFNTDKTEVSLSDFSGKNLIVHFFPAAFTGICTKQLCTLRDGISLYHNDKTDVVAISVDSLFALAKFKEEQNLNFTLLVLTTSLKSFASFVAVVEVVSVDTVLFTFFFASKKEASILFNSTLFMEYQPSEFANVELSIDLYAFGGNSMLSTFKTSFGFNFDLASAITLFELNKVLPATKLLISKLKLKLLTIDFIVVGLNL